ncbi:WXG100 family type VII secretion target [Kibdelosporangium persicum]|uniref:Glycine-rich cell wall structural protein n=1 Tax=Kibdelosporangium persicum TaxID=2698649 RepID=A0ABX2FCN5_9PSEU|nr:Glycine-rich cell wall structural protein [Kibdelosporangium persicum]
MQGDQGGILGGLGTFYQGLLQHVRGALPVRAGRRVEDDIYVTGGTHWNGYSLESLIKMVSREANPAQLQFLADTWRRQGEKLSASAADLQRSLGTLMQFWSGAGADEARGKVAHNARWIAGLGQTATQIAEPVDDSGGALSSAQSTMPGAPKGGLWSGLATAGGAAAAGFAIGGPFGAAAGAVIGGIASAFGFGSDKKKLKRKAVQTMTRYETAILGIDRATPRFGPPSDGIVDPIWNQPGGRGGVGTMPSGVRLPGSGSGTGVGSGGMGSSEWSYGTTPSFADNASARWGALTGAGPYSGGIGSGINVDALRDSKRFAGAVPGVGMPPMFGGGARPTDHANRYGRGNLAGYGPGGMGAAPGRKDEEQEHRRRYPHEEDLFTGDLKAAPPVIGL